MPSIVRFLERADAKLDRSKVFVVATILQAGGAPGWRKDGRGHASKAPEDEVLSQRARDLLQVHAK